MPSIRILVAATDFSDFADRAAGRAAQIARLHGAALHLLHVVRPLDLYPGMALSAAEEAHHDRTVQQAEQSRLDALASRLAGESGIRIGTANRLGRPHREIAAYAQEVGADLVVAGSRGESSLADLLIGSTVSRLLRVAACPVLVVRQASEQPYRHVLAAVDFSPVSRAVVEQAMALAGEARVDALHVLGSEVEQRLRKARLDQVDIDGWLSRIQGEAEARLQSLTTSIPHGDRVGHRIVPGFAPAAICRCVEQDQADLVVLGRHGHGGGLEEWLLGSVSKDVAHAAACDVLLIPPGGH